MSNSLYYKSTVYKRLVEILRDRASATRRDQIHLPSGGMLEKWLVNNQIFLLLFERTQGMHHEWFGDVYVPITRSNRWQKLIGQIDLLANGFDLSEFVKEYRKARESGDYTALDEITSTVE